MKLYREAADKFVAEAGTIRTPISALSFHKDMRLAQRAYPEHHLRDFTTDDLTVWCLTRYDGKPGLPASKTIKKRKSQIMSVFRWAKWKGLIESDVAADLAFTVKPGHGRVRLGNWLTEAEAREVFQAFDMSDQKARRDRLVFMIGVMLGLRVFELAGLRWEMFNDDFSILRIKGKGDKLVDLTVAPQLRAELVAWRAEAPHWAQGVIPAFQSRWNPGTMARERTVIWDRPLTDQAFRYIVQAAGDSIGRKLTPHDLRRSFAGILEEKGVSIRDIQLAGRWSNIATLDGYLKDNPARLGKVMGEMTWEF